MGQRDCTRRLMLFPDGRAWPWSGGLPALRMLTHSR
jgi:hypothetical protein